MPGQQEILSRLLADGFRMYCNPGTVVFLQDEPAQKVFYLVSGLVEISCTDKGGHEKTVYHVKPGEIFGVGGIVDGQLYGVNATVKQKAEIVGLDQQKFFQCLVADPDLAKACVVSFARRLWLTGIHINLLTVQERSFEKIVRALLFLAQYNEGIVVTSVRSDSHIELNLTQEWLGDFLGLSRISVINALDCLEKENVIEKKKGRLVIKDLNRLKAIIE